MYVEVSWNKRKLTDISYTVIEGANHLIRKPYRAYVSSNFPPSLTSAGVCTRFGRAHYRTIRKIYQTAWLLLGRLFILRKEFSRSLVCTGKFSEKELYSSLLRQAIIYSWVLGSFLFPELWGYLVSFLFCWFNISNTLFIPWAQEGGAGVVLLALPAFLPSVFSSFSAKIRGGGPPRLLP